MSGRMNESESNIAVSFREQTWTAKWLFVGLGFLALWSSLRFVDVEWVSGWPHWLLLVVTGLLPQICLLVFPILTREDKGLRIPGFKCWMVELAIATPVVLGTLCVLGGVLNVLYGGEPPTPEAIKGMARSSPSQVYPILIFTFTFAPVAEEIFFRGFIYNMFRRSMPLILAMVLQSLIFGFGHFFGTTHALVASTLGLVFTAMYEWRKTLISPILVHAGINLMFAAGMLFTMSENAQLPVIGVNGERADSACIVRDITPNSAAAASEIMVEDVIVAINEEPVHSMRELAAAVMMYQPGDTVTLKVIRRGEQIEIVVKLKSRGDTF